ncbi:hypothetical protein HPB48_016678 [Haemaphysalis longicornis]|uniref:Runt domain-containing protein n=1 Tax=Haemaphysalis longicornis TaxID=44386 RepID=A0A9J6H002_HAELO|nr:hypothetical protein HPB48_016678 [Haemaphysalis longicornis]
MQPRVSMKQRVYNNWRTAPTRAAQCSHKRGRVLAPLILLILPSSPPIGVLRGSIDESGAESKRSAICYRGGERRFSRRRVRQALYLAPTARSLFCCEARYARKCIGKKVAEGCSACKNTLSDNKKKKTYEAMRKSQLYAPPQQSLENEKEKVSRTASSVHKTAFAKPHLSAFVLLHHLLRVRLEQELHADDHPEHQPSSVATYAKAIKVTVDGPREPRRQQQQFRAFASAFGQRPPFLDPLREWDHLRRKTAEQWALDIPRRIPGAGSHHELAQAALQQLSAADAHWGAAYPHYNPYLAPATGTGGFSTGPVPVSYSLDASAASSLAANVTSLAAAADNGGLSLHNSLLDSSHSPASLASCPLDSVGSHAAAAVPSAALLGTASTPSSDSPLSSTRSLTLDVNAALSATNGLQGHQAADSLLTPPRVTKSPQSLLLGGSNGAGGGGGSSSSSPSSSSLDFLPNPTNYGGFLPTHTYYGSNGASTGTPTTAAQPPHSTAGVYLSPPVVPPSLLYPQLYGSMSHPSFQFLGNDLKCVMDAAGFGTTQQQRQDSLIQPDNTTGIRAQHQHQQQQQQQQQSLVIQQQSQHNTDDAVVSQTASLAVSVLDSLRTPADHHSVWRPY